MKITRRESIKTIVSVLGVPLLLGSEAVAADRLEFKEELSGHITEGIYDFERGEEIGKNKISFKGSVVIDDLDKFEEKHAAKFEGDVTYNGETFPIKNGKVNLLASIHPDYETQVRHLIYLLPFSARNKQQYVLSGYKKIKILNPNLTDFVRDMTTLYTHIHQGSFEGSLDSPKLGPMLGAGIMKFDVADTVDFVKSFSSYKGFMKFVEIIGADLSTSVFAEIRRIAHEIIMGGIF